MNRLNNILYLMVLCIFSHSSLSDLVALGDADLGAVDGEGIGIVLEDFVYNAGESVNGGGTFEISGIQTSFDEDVVLGVSQFYIAGSGSYRGQNATANPVNIGRLMNPFNIELRDGNDPILDIGVTDKAVLEFSAPTKSIGATSGTTSYFSSVYETRVGDPFNPGAIGQRVVGFLSDTSVLSSRSTERPNMGIRFDLEVATVRAQSLESHIESLAIDGSYLRLWGGGSRMEGELALNIYTPSIEVIACDALGANCGDSVNFLNVAIEAELGDGDYQPVTFEVDGTGNFIFEVGTLAGKCASTNATGGCNSGVSGYTDLAEYYNSGPATNVYIGDVQVGGQSYGSSTVSNLQIQYLHVQSHDL